MRFHPLSKAGSALFLAASFALLTHPASAQPDHNDSKYTLASICGDYGAIATYGANVARALGHETMDGHGRITGAAIVNQPATSTTRSIVSIGISGTYTVNPDGSGQMFLTIDLPGGATASVTEDFVITRSKTMNGTLTATEIEDAQEVPSAVIEDSSLVIHSYTLRNSSKSCRAD